MKLKSFGCSFIFGTDLHDDGVDGTWATPSQFTWPALLAQDLGYEYKCRARPGSGNLQILHRLLNDLVQDPADFYVIGWTWTDRFDYVSCDAPGWQDRLSTQWTTLMPIDTAEKSTFYYRNLHSEYRDKFTNLVYIKTAIDVLRNQGKKIIMTYMDDLLFCTQYHLSAGMTALMSQVQPLMSNFSGKNFLQWSQDNGHAISATSHPLESAHRAAADHVLQNLENFVKT